ncbi:GNAT family N-acetyltransferase [Rufibacter latericius]|uniref:GNAT family N-acetyltransferase n=1 Tax=Rufibacter latericius TaxID=2487040 RepID=A0A3M9MDH9_9BACT|nr:GNAT family N-acetyltransferase [Rufibacter latericius]RNI23622.1 GNAT family N-acetyltransferase [Rufibacter latericius]
MNPKVEIREYVPEDKPAIVELLKLNTPAYFAPEEEPDLIHYLDHEIEQYFVVLDEQRLVGCGGVNFSEDLTTGKISWDILHPQYQGKGLGSLLLNYRIKKLQELPHIQTISVRTSQLVYRFYEKQGFQLQEVVKDYWAPGFDMYRMEYVQP